MVLKCRLFRGDKHLEECAVRDSAHITRGAAGWHVAKIQSALFLLDGCAIARGELLARRYGHSTARAVLAYKKARSIINRAYQTKADDIVGKMTIASLDEGMSRHEKSCRHTGFLFGKGRPAPPVVMQEPDSAFYYTRVRDTQRHQRDLHGSIGPSEGGDRRKILAAAHHTGEGWRDEYWSATPLPLPTPKGPPGDLDWCSIYATWVWKQAGFEVSWNRDGTTGLCVKKDGQWTKVAMSSDRSMIFPGDIIVDTFATHKDKHGKPVKNLHHMIVLDIGVTGKTANVISGNAAGGKVVIDHARTIDATIGYFFSLDTCRWGQTYTPKDMRG